MFWACSQVKNDECENTKGENMQNLSKSAKIACMLVFSIILSTVVQASAFKGSIINEDLPVISTEKIVNKTSKQNTQKSTEKPKGKKAKDEKTKATEAPTEVATVPVTEPIEESATEEITEAPTEANTELPTFSVEIQFDEYSLGGTTGENNVIVAPTEAPTEWSQELQDCYDEQFELGYLIAIDNPDYNYSTNQIKLNEFDRKLACQIVFGEAGGEGFAGMCLVAQCLKDSMSFLGYSSIKEVQTKCKYDGWKEKYSEEAELAVSYIFDQNKSAIAHRIFYFYATNLVNSKWHETQNYILTYNKTRFFDEW